jgi:hypothetical protein
VGKIMGTAFTHLQLIVWGQSRSGQRDVRAIDRIRPLFQQCLLNPHDGPNGGDESQRDDNNQNVDHFPSPNACATLTVREFDWLESRVSGR